MGLSRELVSLIHRTLRLEHMSNGQTVLQPFHCPDHGVSQEITSINVYVCGGLEVNTGTRNYDIPEGQALIIPSGKTLKLRNLAPGRTISIWNTIEFSILDTINPFTLLDIPIAIDEVYGVRVEAINRKARDLMELGDARILEQIVGHHALALELFNIILEVSGPKPNALEILLRTERLQPALQFIKDNLRGVIRSSDLAKTVHVSEPRLFELFRDAIGIPPGKYIQKLRLRKAQELLIGSDMRIGEIGVAIGYDDQFHFSRLFRKNFGVGPQLFRKQYRASKALPATTPKISFQLQNP